jgi:flavin reductase
VAVSKEAYRDAMARLGAAVNIVTTNGPAGQRGFTASAVCSVTDDPPTLLVCVNRTNDSHIVMKDNACVCVNVLTHKQQELSPVFAGLTDRATEQRFEVGMWDRMVTGAPSLVGAAVSFDCRVAQIVEVGTHDVFFCEVEAIRTGSVHEGLIYYGRAYHRIAQPT